MAMLSVAASTGMGAAALPDHWRICAEVAAEMRREALEETASLGKDTGARLLISDPVRAAAALADARDLGPMPIRGYDEQVRVWRVA